MDFRKHIENLARGFMPSVVLLTACEMGMFECLEGQALSGRELANRLALDPRATQTVLLALTGLDILIQENGRFRLAPEYAPYLLKDSPQSQANIFIHNYHIMLNWVRLREVLKTGRPTPKDEEISQENWMQAFIRGMADLARESAHRVAERLDLKPYRRMLDLGGGPGTTSIIFAQRHPDLECVVFDLPGPLVIAREMIQQAGLEERIQTRAGDYFTDEVGEGFDLVYVANIIHSMGPQVTTLIAEKCQRALVPGGTLAIKEFFLDEDRAHPLHAALFSVNMLVGTPAGQSYTVAETEAILGKAGFGNFELIEIDPVSKVLLGRKI